MSVFAGYNFLFFLGAAAGVLLFGSCADFISFRAHKKAGRWIYDILWFAVMWIILICGAGLSMWIMDADYDIITWTYVGTGISAVFFALLNAMFFRFSTLSRTGYWVAFRLFLAAFVTIPVNEFVYLGIQSMVIEDRLEAVKGSAYGTEGVYTWGDGGNSMTTSWGLGEYDRRSFRDWMESLTEAAVSAFVIVLFLVMMRTAGRTNSLVLEAKRTRNFGRSHYGTAIRLSSSGALNRAFQT